MADSHRKMGVVFASAEAAPFVKTGGLGDVAGSLPAALARAGVDVVVMVPKYATIDDAYRQQMEHVCDFYVPLGWRNEYCGLERLDRDGVTYLFVDNERYFDRSYPYGFFDDGERFAFFSKAVCESLQHLPAGFTCNVLHCNDWHTALAPVFLREFYQGLPLYENVKTVFSIHNIAFQGQFSDKVLTDILGLAHIPAAASQLRCDADSVNYMMGALNYADAITTVSPTYAAEIQTPAFGEHLDGVLRRRSVSLQGIVNGIDTARFDPATDSSIAANYTADDLSGKAACKKALQEELGLTARTDQPILAMVTRLTRQKGLDLVTYALDRILSGGVQVAVLGTGDAEYENALRYFESKYPGQMAARIQFDPALSQRIYAGADLFLMPSLFEPCGLSQMIAMRYGTLPVVRETGGLKDTVTPYNYETGEGTGFSFAHFNGEEMGDAVFRGARLFWDEPDAFRSVVKQAMARDFSWKQSADKYLDLYFWLHPEIERPAEGVAVAGAGEGAEAADRPAEEAGAKPEESAKEAEAASEAAARAQAEALAEEKRAAEEVAVRTEAAAEAAAEEAAAKAAEKERAEAAAKKAAKEAAAKAKAEAEKRAAEEKAAKEAAEKRAAAAAAKKAAEEKAAEEAAAKKAAEEAAAKAEAEKQAAAAAAAQKAAEEKAAKEAVEKRAAAAAAKEAAAKEAAKQAAAKAEAEAAAKKAAAVKAAEEKAAAEAKRAAEEETEAKKAAAEKAAQEAAAKKAAEEQAAEEAERKKAETAAKRKAAAAKRAATIKAKKEATAKAEAEKAAAEASPTKAADAKAAAPATRKRSTTSTAAKKTATKATSGTKAASTRKTTRTSVPTAVKRAAATAKAAEDVDASAQTTPAVKKPTAAKTTPAAKAAAASAKVAAAPKTTGAAKEQPATTPKSAPQAETKPETTKAQPAASTAKPDTEKPASKPSATRVSAARKTTRRKR